MAGTILTAGIDVGGTHIRTGIFNSTTMQVEDIATVSSEALKNSSDPLSYLVSLIGEYCNGKNVKAAGIGIPGTLDRNCETVMNAPNIPCLNGIALKRGLERQLGFPVYPENDTVMLLHGDLHTMGIKNEGCIMGCYIGTGLGAALFNNGRAAKGRNGICEIGHVPVYGKNDPCTCGNRGCAENYVSGRFLEKLREMKYPETHISEVFTVIKGSAEYTEYIDILSSVLAGAVNILDPGTLIIGGGVAAMLDFPKRELTESVLSRAMKPYPALNLEILFSSSGGEPGVLGAALYAASGIGG